jgi:uncharacterized protein (TIGR03435 family)
MRRLKIRYAIYVFVALICTTLGAQDARVRPQFVVASIRPVTKGQIYDPAIAKAFQEARRNTLRGGEITMTGSDRVHLEGWPLLDLIAAAYGVRVSQVSGPSWLSDQCFDIEALVPVGTQKGELDIMLQSLLEERFALRVHRITQTKQGYALTVAKGGPKLTPAELPHDPSQGLNGKEHDGQATQGLAAMTKQMKSTLNNDKSGAGFAMSSWSSITLEELAHRLDQFTKAPVVNETGLAGKYSMIIEVSNDPYGSGNTIFNAIEDLGLKLKSRKVPIEIVVVDQVSKAPTAN